MWGLYLAWRNTWRHSSCCAQCALRPDFIPPDLRCLNSTDLNPADYFFSSIMQEKVYQTHIANIEEWKYRLVQVWAELDHRLSLQLSDWGDAVSMHVTRVWKLREIFWTTLALNLHVALWAICWIVGLSNIYRLTLPPADFECFVLYYSRFCAFCVWYGFNLSYYHKNKHLRICLHCVMRELFLNKMLQKLQKYLNRWRSYGDN